MTLEHWDVVLLFPDSDDAILHYAGKDFFAAVRKVTELLENSLLGVSMMRVDPVLHCQAMIDFWQSSNLEQLAYKPFAYRVFDNRFEDGHICTIELRAINYRFG